MKKKREITESKYPPVNNEDLWLKDGKLYYSTSQGWVPLSEEPSITETYEQGVSSISYSGKDGNEHQIELSENVESDVTNIINDTFVTDEDNNVTFTDDNDTEHTLVTTDALPSILANNSMLEVTWLLLKDLRDNSQLTLGCLYRITDYNCTTTQENTQSAGHLFDIVLLALSENKLAEEGWAMEHPSDVYDVTFSDNVILKCYIYDCGDDSYNIVAVDSKLGMGGIDPAQIIFDETNKTASVAEWYPSTNMIAENLHYNYFQNSNLSAWKVWYCLDNDTARFAWADDSVDESSPASITNSTNNYNLQRYPDLDTSVYAWKKEDIDLTMYTASETPQVGDSLLTQDGTIGAKYGTVSSFTPAHEGTGLPNGRGVIYRLIDEFNNDIKYDFKNIQFKRTIMDGEYDEEGEETWCYTLNVWYDNICQDASIVGNTLPNDEGFVSGVYNNVFGCATAYDLHLEGVNTFAFALGDNVILSIPEGGEYYGIYANTIGNVFFSNTIENEFLNNIIGNRFISNLIKCSFSGNTIGNDFGENAIIGYSFNTNMIGNGFISNTTTNIFDDNIIGNYFQNKTISSDTSYKNYGSNGVELATKNDIGDIETALSNI